MKGLVKMALYCEDEFKQMQKEKQEQALYYWHGISIKELVKICLKMGVTLGIGICNNENDDTVKEEVSFILIEETVNKIMQILSSRFSDLEDNTINKKEGPINDN